MLKRAVKIFIALLIGGVFMWLAFRNVKLDEVWKSAEGISFGWILPFCLTVFASNALRAVRWGLLIEYEKEDLSKITLVAGVLTGYLLNFVGPRFGDVSRPLYVAKREGLSSSKLIGTIVLERVIDLATLILLMIIVVVYLISDLGLLRQIFGNETMDILTRGVPFVTTLWSILTVAVITGICFVAVKIIQRLAARVTKMHDWLEKFKEGYQQFKDGLLAIRKVKRWWLFLFYTVLLWGCYVFMTYIPFYMFDMQSVYHLNLLDALTLTAISAIGIAIPSPGGIGTYHYFVKKSLLVLFAVPAVTGLAYATVTHAATFLTVLLSTPVILAVDKWRQARAGKDPI